MNSNPKFRTTNSHYAYELLVRNILLWFITLLALSATKTSLIILFLTGFGLVSLTAFSIYLSVKNAYELEFHDTHILQRYTFSKKVIIYEYSDLHQVSYYHRRYGHDLNRFIFQKEHEFFKMNTKSLANRDNFVSVLRWLKTKKPKFQTFVFPKGSSLHSLLRAELATKKNSNSHGK